MLSVRGIGVAVSVSTCTSARSALSRSLSRTPKRCSSSTMIRPRSRKRTLACSRRWVAMTMSIVALLDALRGPRAVSALCESATAPRCAPASRRSGRESSQVLLRQQRRRHQHRDLAPGLHGDERGAHRHLGLAEADIAADDAIHRLRACQILEHLADGLGLVGGLLERESVGEGLVFEFAHAAGAAAWCAARRACRSSSSAATSRTCSAARLRALAHWSVPSLCSGALSGRRAGVAIDQMQRVHRHIDAIAVPVLEHQELARLSADLHRPAGRRSGRRRSSRAPPARRVRGLQIAQDRRRIRGRPAARRRSWRARVPNSCDSREQRNGGLRELQAADILGDGDRERASPSRERLPVRHAP